MCAKRMSLGALAVLSVAVIFAIVLSGCDKFGEPKAVSTVKKGTLEGCLDFTVGEIIDADPDRLDGEKPKWEHFVGENGIDYVNVSQYQMIGNKPARMVTQFWVRNSTFGIQAFKKDELSIDADDQMIAEFVEGRCAAARIARMNNSFDSQQDVANTGEYSDVDQREYASAASRLDIEVLPSPSAKAQLAGAGSMSGDGGDPQERVTQMGVLGIVPGEIKGKSASSADIFGKGGFATDIDAVLSGVGGLKSGGDGGVGRKGVAGIGYGSGYGSGFGTGGGDGGSVDDLLGGLMGGGGGLDLKKRGELKVSSPDFPMGDAPPGGAPPDAALMGAAPPSGSLTGGRSRASIQRVVMQNMAALRYAYSRRLRDKPGLAGKIVVKLAIDEYGKVISAQVVESTMTDSELERTVVDRVKSWNFDKIDKPGDVTEVTYPFTFSQ